MIFNKGEEVLAKCGDAFYRSIVINVHNLDTYQVQLIDHDFKITVSKTKNEIKKFGSDGVTKTSPVPEDKDRAWTYFGGSTFFENNVKTPRSPVQVSISMKSPRQSLLLKKRSSSKSTPNMYSSPSMSSIRYNLDQIMCESTIGYDIEKIPRSTFPLSPGNNKFFPSYSVLPQQFLNDHNNSMSSGEPLSNDMMLYPEALNQVHHQVYSKGNVKTIPVKPTVNYQHGYCSGDHAFQRFISRNGIGQNFTGTSPLCQNMPPFNNYRTWQGKLPAKNLMKTEYSRKVFLGGVPWDIKNEDLEVKFSEFGSLQVEWPPSKNGIKPRGFVYIVFNEQSSVNRLLEHCRWSARYFRNQYEDDGMVYKSYVRSGKMPNKEIQVVPWNVHDSTKLTGQQDKVNMRNQVFVGGLHGMFTATFISQVMSDVFGDVVYVEIDTDKYCKYPLGSGRVNFSSKRSYTSAIEEKFLNVLCENPKIVKRIQIDPYINENETCSICGEPRRPIVFCRASSCLDYFCDDCFNQHTSNKNTEHERVSRQRYGKMG